MRLRLLLFLPGLIQVFITGNLCGQSAFPDTTASRFESREKYSNDTEDDLNPFMTEILKEEVLLFPGIINVEGLLQGRVSGLSVTTATGEPGTADQMLIFNGSTFKNYRPLVVIDGLPLPQYNQFFNWLSDNSSELKQWIPVAVKDISSLKILHGEEASVLYGPEGSNGAILIETRRNDQGQFHAEYDVTGSVMLKPASLALLNGDEYIMQQLEAWHNAYGIFEVPSELAYDRDYPDFYNYSANTDWPGAVLKTGFSMNHYLNLSGRKDKNRFSLSGSFLDRSGNLINTGYKREYIRSSLDHEFSGRFRAGIRLNYTGDHYNGNYLPDDENGNENDLLRMAYHKASNMSILQYDPEGQLTGKFFTPSDNYQGNGNYYYNPVALAEYSYARKKLKILEGSMHLIYEPFNFLKISQQFAGSRTVASNLTFLDQSSFSYFDSDSLDQKISFLMNVDRFYSRTDFRFRVPLRNEESQSLNVDLSWTSIGEKTYITPPDNSYLTIPENQSRHALNTAIHYNFKSSLLLSVLARTDAYPGKNDDFIWLNQYQAYSGYRFSNLEFFRQSGILQEGLVYLSFSDLTSDYRLFPSAFNAFKSKNNTIKGGLDLGILRDRVNISVQGFYRRYKLNTDFEADNLFVDIGNRGIDLSTELKLIGTRDLSVRAYANLEMNRYNYLSAVGYSSDNKPGDYYCLDYLGIYFTDDEALARNENGTIITDPEGNPLQKAYLGNRSYYAGDANYRDVNYDGIINNSDWLFMGNSIPRFFGGFGSSIRYRNFDLAFRMMFRAGYQIMNSFALDMENGYSRNNNSRSVLNHWRIDGQTDPDLYPKPILNNNASFLVSDRYLENGSFLKLKYLNLGYRFNQSVCSKIRLSALSVNLSVQNLFCLTAYSGLDPEIPEYLTLYPGIRDDYIKAPAPLTISLSLSASL